MNHQLITIICFHISNHLKQHNHFHRQQREYFDTFRLQTHRGGNEVGDFYQIVRCGQSDIAHDCRGGGFLRYLSCEKNLFC